MYIRKIITIVLLMGLLIAGVVGYKIYTAVFSSNTVFVEKQKDIYIPTGATFLDIKKIIIPYLKDISSFEMLAEKKGYAKNVKAGKYILAKGMNNNAIINTLRSKNIPVRVAFNNQETITKLAGRIASQIEADSLALLQTITNKEFLQKEGFTIETALAMYIPNTYEFFWNTSAEQFRERMLAEYKAFWNNTRLKKAQSIKLTPHQILTLASIVHEETVKVEERPRVAGVYLNRLKEGMLLQADPTVIYALKLHTNNFDTVIKRVLYKDLEIDSPYNTYLYTGLPPGPIAMPDISAIDAVLSPEKHEYYYFVADVSNFGYHKFAKTLQQHNRNRQQYITWINTQKINR